MIEIQSEDGEYYCSHRMHPMIMLEKVGNFIVETLNNFVDTFLPRCFDILLLLNGKEKFS